MDRNDIGLFTTVDSIKANTKKQELNFGHHAKEAFKCECDLCTKQTKKIVNKAERGISEQFFDMPEVFNAKDEPEKDFVFILKKLAPPK